MAKALPWLLGIGAAVGTIALVGAAPLPIAYDMDGKPLFEGDRVVAKAKLMDIYGLPPRDTTLEVTNGIGGVRDLLGRYGLSLKPEEWKLVRKI